MVLGKMGPVQWENLLLCGSLTFTSRSKTGTFRAQKQAFIQKKTKLANLTCVGGGGGGGGGGGEQHFLR